MEKKLKFVFAVNHSNKFEALHFGDADKYLIYEWNANEITLTNEIINEYKLVDEEHEHGSKMKGDLIIDMFQKNDIKVLVSKQFGPNVKMINKFFIPIIIYNNTIDDVILALKRHIFWIQDELINRPKEFKLFTIKQGILKTAISDKK